MKEAVLVVKESERAVVEKREREKKKEGRVSEQSSTD